MLSMIVVLLAVTGLVQSSGVAPVAPVGHAPVVTAASSQYFERTFNRLVVAPPILEPVIPIAPVASSPPVVVEPVTRTVPVVTPSQNVPVEPNIAIAIATAHAAAPVATILLPPYPFGPPPTIGFIPPTPTVQVAEEESKKESTTQQTTKVDATTTVRELEPTTPFPLASNNANSFAQGLPSNKNVNFKHYYAPPLPSPAARPQKLKTSVEIVPVPLTYIAPPPARLITGHHHHHHTHAKPIKYVHSFIPTRARIVIRPTRIRTVRGPARLVMYKVPMSARNVARNFQSVQRSLNSREIEPTTFRPFNRPITKPPRT